MTGTDSTEATPSTPPPALVAEAQWKLRCVSRIRARDAGIDPGDATDLAETLWERESCRAIAPELAADRMFDGNLRASTWGDL